MKKIYNFISGKAGVVMNKDVLKMAALICMAADHAGIVLYTLGVAGPAVYVLLRSIGRLAFPLYAFCFVDAYTRTGDRERYLLRLLLLAFLSEVPYNLFVSGRLVDISGRNVIFTYVLGFLLLEALGRLREVTPFKVAGLIALAMICAELLSSDYGAYGILAIAAFYLFPVQDKGNAWIYIVVTAAFVAGYGALGIFAGAAFLLAAGYDGSPAGGGRRMRMFGYLFFPLHLLLFGLLMIFLKGV